MRPGSRLGLLTDQQRGEVGGWDLYRANDQLRNENGAIDDDHLLAIGQLDHQVATQHLDVGKFDTGGQRDDTVRPRGYAHGIRADHRRRVDDGRGFHVAAVHIAGFLSSVHHVGSAVGQIFVSHLPTLTLSAVAVAATLLIKLFGRPPLRTR